MKIAGTQTEPPARPEFVTGEAREEWDRLVELLVSSGHLARIDADILAAYCATWCDYVTARTAINAEGLTITTANGKPRPHPLLRASERAMSRLWQFSDRLGLSPLARARIDATRAKAARKKSPISGTDTTHLDTVIPDGDGNFSTPRGEEPNRD